MQHFRFTNHLTNYVAKILIDVQLCVVIFFSLSLDVGMIPNGMKQLPTKLMFRSRDVHRSGRTSC